MFNKIVRGLKTLFSPPPRALWQNGHMSQEDLTDLIDWLNTKDPDETYEPGDPTRCFIYQYFQDTGRPVVYVGSSSVSTDYKGGEFQIPPEINAIAGVTEDVKWGDIETFGAALERARSYITTADFIMPFPTL